MKFNEGSQMHNLLGKRAFLVGEPLIDYTCTLRPSILASWRVSSYVEMSLG